MVSASASCSAAMPKSVRTTRWPRRSTRRLDVPVQYSPGVHLAQRSDQFEPDTGRGGRVERAVLDHELFEGAAGDEFHDDPQSLALVHDVVDAHDIGMVDPGRGPGFAQSALAAGSGVLRVESVDPHFLDGDLPVEHFVGGSPHPSHSPLANTLGQPISTRHQ
jgi:hypothetical protein